MPDDSPTIERELARGVGLLPTMRAIWSTLRTNFVGIVVVTAFWSIPAVLVGVVSQLVSRTDSADADFSVYVGIGLYLVWVWAIGSAMASIAVGALERLAGRDSTIRDAVRTTLSKVWPITAYSFLVLLLMAIADVVLRLAARALLPESVLDATLFGSVTVKRTVSAFGAMWVGTRLIATIPSIMEGNRTPLRTSWALTRGQWAPIYVLSMLWYFAFLVPMGVLEEFVETREGLAALGGSPIVAISGIFSLTIASTAAVVIHHRLRCVKDGIHLSRVIDVFS